MFPRQSGGKHQDSLENKTVSLGFVSYCSSSNQAAEVKVRCSIREIISCHEVEFIIGAHD